MKMIIIRISNILDYLNQSLTAVSKFKTTSVLGMYDSYVLSIRWASNRLNDKGVVDLSLTVHT